MHGAHVGHDRPPGGMKRAADGAGRVAGRGRGGLGHRCASILELCEQVPFPGICCMRETQVSRGRG